jgi:hypothetical protein
MLSTTANNQSLGLEILAFSMSLNPANPYVERGHALWMNSSCCLYVRTPASHYSCEDIPAAKRLEILVFMSLMTTVMGKTATYLLRNITGSSRGPEINWELQSQVYVVCDAITMTSSHFRSLCAGSS